MVPIVVNAVQHSGVILTVYLELNQNISAHL